VEDYDEASNEHLDHTERESEYTKASITFWRTVVHAGSLYRSCMEADTVLNLSTNLRESNQT